MKIQKLSKTDLSILDNDAKGFVELLYNHRKETEKKETPIQYKGLLPMGGEIKNYVKAPYMIDEFKKFCNELYEIHVVKTELVDLGMGGDNLPEKWYSVIVEGKDRSTGNILTGVGASRVKYAKATGNIVNFRHDMTAAETYAYKDLAKNFGIGADVYGRDVEGYSEQVQCELTATHERIKQNYGAGEAERFLKVIEGMDEETLIAKIESINDKLNQMEESK